MTGRFTPESAKLLASIISRAEARARDIGIWLTPPPEPDRYMASVSAVECAALLREALRLLERRDDD